MKENDPRRKYLKKSQEWLDDCKKEIKICAQILNILTENKCSISNIESILHKVESQVKESSTLCQTDFLKKLTQKYNNLLPEDYDYLSEELGSSSSSGDSEIT